MLEKYRATIHGDRIEWESETPAGLENGEGVEVYITLADKPVSRSKANVRRAVEALQAIVDRGGIRSIPDPVKWQREIRKDRPCRAADGSS